MNFDADRLPLWQLTATPMLKRFIIRICGAFCTPLVIQRNRDLEQELREAQSIIVILTKERDELLAVLERNRQRIEAETRIEIARGLMATGEQPKQ